MSDNQQFCLRWNNHQSTLVQVIDSLLSSGVLVDCTLAAEGQYLHAHKVVLCACSPYLETLLSQHYEKHPIVILKDVKFQELKSMMDYMYKGEVNISQDQLGQFLKAAESLQIKGLTDGGGGENDSKDVGSTSHKRHDPPPIRKSVPPNQSRSSVVLPSHGTGLTIEPSKRSLPSHLSESQPDSPNRSREGSSSPTPRKRRRPRRPSQGDDDGHQDNCDLPMQQQSILNTVPIIPQLPAGSSSTITKAPPPDDEPDQPAESDVRLAESGLLKEKIEPQSELLIEPKTEYMEETNNDDSVEDLTLDDDDEYDNMDGAGPSHGGDNSNQSYGQWQMGERTHDEVFMAAQEAVGGGPRDSQDSAARITITREQSLRLQKLLHEKPAGKRKFTDQEIRKNASRLKIPAVKIRYWLKQRNALDEGPKRRAPSAMLDIRKPRSKLFSDLSYEKKILLLRKTCTTTNVTHYLTQELSQELQIPENRIYNWLKHKVHRNLKMKKSLSAEESAALRTRFAELDYLDDDTALVLADRFNVGTAVIKKAFQRHKPAASLQVDEPVVEVKRYHIPASVTVTKVPKITKSLAKSKIGKTKTMTNKTVDQKNLLFEAFRESPTLTKTDTLAKLMNTTGLTNRQVTKWLSVFRTKWSQNNESGLKKMLTRGLSQSQLVSLEKAYREERFLTNAQLIELPKTVGLSLRALQSWFSNRRVYEIRSSNKDIVNIGPKTAAARKESTQPVMLKPTIAIPQTAVPQQQRVGQLAVDDSASDFFDSLSKEQKIHLKAACKNYNVSYKRLAQALSLPTEKVEHYIKSYRVRHAMFRVSKHTLPERVHKALLNHYLKYGKISSKTSVMLAKRLKIRPEQIVNWNKTHTKRVLEVGGVVKPPSAGLPTVKPVAIKPAVVEKAAPAAEEYVEPSKSIPAPVRKTSTKKAYSRGGSRYFAAAAAKELLFEEFKKSPQAATAKTKQIANMVKLTPAQVRKWIYNFGKKLGDQSKSKIIACLNSSTISVEARARLEEVYRDRRFLEESEMDTLGAQIGLNRRQIVNWFINARYYEALVGKCPGEGSRTPHVQTPPKPASTPKSFYESLDAQKQARLNDELSSYPFSEEKLHDLADELEAESSDLKKWFENYAGGGKTRRRSLLPPAPNPLLSWLNLTIKQMETLVNEFDADPIMTDERAGSMAKRIKVTKDRIKAWFENRKQEAQLETSKQSDKFKLQKHKIPPIKIIMPKYPNSNDDLPTIAPPAPDTSLADSAASKKSYECKVPVQQNKLFEEFKRSSSLTNERLAKISEDTNLSGKQISAWFSWLNYKLSTIQKDSLLEENRNKYLTLQQIDELESQYAENRYVNRSARESLSIALGVPKNIIKSWFASRRYYEILSRDGSANDVQQGSPRYEANDGVEEDLVPSETVIDYDWEDGSAVVDESIDTFEPKFDVDRPLEVDPLSEEPIEDIKTDVVSYNFQLSPNSPFVEDFTSLPYQPRDRFTTPLGKDLEPLEEDVEKLFWFANKTPNKIDPKYDREIDEAKNRILDGEFGKYPWPDLDRISQLSAQLLVSQPKIHWWFIKKRCFLTKTILTLPPAPQPKPKPKPDPKNLLIDLTDDDALNAESEPPKLGEFEFVTLDETPQIKEEEEEPLGEENNLENGDPFENNAIDEQSSASFNNVEEPPQESNESVDNTTTSTSPAIKKKKKKIPLTSHQRAILMQEYKRNKVITSSQARMLAQDLGLGVSRVEAWFESMKKSAAQKKANPSETSVSVKGLSSEIQSGLEAEYLKSANLSDKRAKMIALKLNTRRKTVKKWFTERAKKKDELE